MTTLLSLFLTFVRKRPVSGHFWNTSNHEYSHVSVVISVILDLEVDLEVDLEDLRTWIIRVSCVSRSCTLRSGH